MAIQRKEYELSVWNESLGDNGQKIESKSLIIGAHDMTFAGRATSIKLTTKINGTHSLTFQMPDKYFDSEKGEFVQNEFVEELFAEKKLKLHYNNEWFEFYIKEVSEKKNYKSYMKSFTCSDAFIDELSRNGYGITFSTDLYNNVEEAGDFTETILEDSIWGYRPENNWGDFTEYSEEKLFKIPTNLFKEIRGHKLKYQIEDYDDEGELLGVTNVYNHKFRQLELGDDLARAVDGQGGYFWDSIDGKMPLLEDDSTILKTDYIYIPYSQLEFCYKTTSTTGVVLTATEEVCYYQNDDIASYALAPNTVDPTSLIQFICIPEDAEVEVDEAGLIVDKEYTYVMTVEDWNETVLPKYFYQFLPDNKDKYKYYKTIDSTGADGTIKYDDINWSIGNLAIGYDGYLDKIGDLEVIYGKKISITDRTEVNITEEIDQYTTVYNKLSDYYTSVGKDKVNLFTNTDGYWDVDSDGNLLNLNGYRVCSKTDTRQIVPQLAQNLAENAVNMTSTDGWDVQDTYTSDDGTSYITTAEVSYEQLKESTEEGMEDDITDTAIDFCPSYQKVPYSYTVTDDDEEETEYTDYEIKTLDTISSVDDKERYNRVLNFGIVSQDEKIQSDKIYCLGFRCRVYIADGGYNVFGKHDEVSYVISDDEYVQNKTTEWYRPQNKVDDGAATVNNIAAYAKMQIGNGEVETLGSYNFETIFDLDLSTVSSTEHETDMTDSFGNKISYVEYEGYYFVKFNETIDNPYLAFLTNSEIQICELWFFEAYTKGIDQFDDPEDGKLYYRYSGRELFDTDVPNVEDNYKISDVMTKEEARLRVLFEDDVMEGDTYGYQRYYIQRVKAFESDKDTGSRENLITVTADTFAAKELLNCDSELIEESTTGALLPLSSRQFSEDDLETSTCYIDMNKCPYYCGQNARDVYDCGFKEGGTTCLYQKYGYCPYLFTSEKHCRKIRTLSKDKSNRFNLTQELSKVFEMYPIYYIEHDSQGKVITEEVTKLKDGETITYNRMKKDIFYITEKGTENKLGFRYEKNLSDISRTIKSDSIVTKLYVEDVDSDLSDTGLCSIKTAEDNPSKDNYIIDFSYYTTKGILDKDYVDADLYGKDSNDMGFLKQLGYFNTQYDKISDQIINLSNQSYTELEANLEVNFTAITTAQEQLAKYKKQMAKYKTIMDESTTNTSVSTSYDNYKEKYDEQLALLNETICATFFDDENKFINLESGEEDSRSGKEYATCFFDNMSLDEVKESPYVKQHTYTKGILGQFNKEYLQIAEWKKQQATYLKEINRISLEFYQKYEPFLKEGTWTDSNYLSDNAYYFGAKEVAKDGAIPSVSYTISTVDLSSLPEYEDDYKFEIADTTYVEDIGMFGINKKTGLPNRLKVIISEISYDLDEPKNNDIKVQNFTTQFEDLFSQVTATVQSLTYNENIYKRSSNFTSNQNVETDSLQGTLDTNDLTLVSTEESNIEIDSTGQSGSDINNHNNQYKLDGQGLAFSNNGGQSWNVGVGPSGINADYIKVGTLDSGKIRIVDSDYLYFLWDKTGITAFRDPQSNVSASSNGIFSDYALFNKYGLSLVEDKQIRLRAGYEFNGSDGIIDTENTTGKNIGFYLYNDKGDAIFKTSTVSSKDESYDESARIYLAGEMFITDTVKATAPSSETYTYNNAYLIEKQTTYQISKSNIAITYSEEEIIGTEETINMIECTHNGGYTNNLYQLIKNKISLHVLATYSEQITTDDGFTQLMPKNKCIVTVNFNDYIKYFSIESFNGEDVIGQDMSSSDKEILDIGMITVGSHLISSVTVSGTKVSYTNGNLQNFSVFYTGSYDIAKDKFYTKDGTISLNYLVNSSKTAEITTSKLTNSLITYYAKEDNLYVKYSNVSLYYDSNILGGWNYWASEEKNSQTEDDDDDENVTTSVALYLNNTNVKNSDSSTSSGEERLICAAINDTQSKDKTTNLFSILKNGNLYIGGKIQTNDDTPKDVENSQEVPIEIQIENALLETDAQEGKIKLDFENLLDRESGKTLEEWLGTAASSVGYHIHTLEEAVATIVPYSDSEEESETINVNYLPSINDNFTEIKGKSTMSLQEFLGQLGIDESGAELFKLLITLFTKGVYTCNTGDGGSIKFSDTIAAGDDESETGGKYKLTFEDSYTGAPVGISNGTAYTGYGLLDPIQEGD